MGACPLLELSDHDHKLLDHCTIARAVYCHCILFNASRMVEDSYGFALVQLADDVDFHWPFFCTYSHTAWFIIPPFPQVFFSSHMKSV